MFVGICTLECRIQEAHSLKEKRSVVKSVMERIKARFNVSIIEADQQDIWQRAEIGFACVSLSQIQARKTVEKIIDFIEKDHRLEIMDSAVEIL
ncbi:DUF503 domain-containing protein [Irregularibacter muris]|uniref:DUF503 domain-containing protein n=1 Tax=Irregularibacter muris TaxID=1796619 RepID=A0AAE3HG11_9FIRM|nr:DUF503 domain-containing protein [Irregularibacter muris]MCR1898354.1 DUF503 domain-containing protein [Irregularibacter muris]